MTQLATDVDFVLSNGKTIPALGLGTVPPEDPHELKEQVITAVKAGYRHIDTAWYYGTEEYIGQALKQLFEEGIVKREDLFITTKVWPSFWRNPEKSLDKSLADLGLDYVDLFLQHWPVVLHGDENGLPPQPRDKDGKLIYDDDPVSGIKYIDAYHSLEDIMDNTSKVKSIGVSNYSIPKLRKLLAAVRKHKPVVNQIEYHPLLPQQDLVKYCYDNGVHISAYSPVGSNGAPVLKLQLINELASKYDVSVNEIANAYHILQGRSVLPRSSNLERIKSIIRLPNLTTEELNALYQIGVESPTRYINDEWGYGLGFKWWKGDTLSKDFD
ncbi:D-arabinose dehydrogenase [Scheffersomyces stipitis CBS 6054]|uniref:D-arabinose dehydrogenase n=1 Tax=Scheffersomyces stipitis (strain ATCC 58785 / CBS 6054 / NBRC 10063 / NRRL Y-11545) TaxID=322104 RepID=A3LTU8_PICST|nr:D-arabinose dehydrogenase [Scheffersomyces stipitis CBS 6054]ABN66127.1 D-arabinose dehydrogenase [Scheffersomyces stipitis CBS 6054]